MSLASDQDACGNYKPIMSNPPMTTVWTSNGGEVLLYVSDPTAEGVVPRDQTQPAVCYQQDGTGPTYTWNIRTHVWQ